MTQIKMMRTFHKIDYMLIIFALVLMICVILTLSSCEPPKHSCNHTAWDRHPHAPGAYNPANRH